MRNKKVLFLTQAAVIAALYVVLCEIFAPISFKEVQLRIAEALTILPFFTPAAIPGLFVGCLLGNLLAGAIPLDIVCGSLATLAGALGTWGIGQMIRKKHLKAPVKYLLPVPPILANAIIVPFVLYYGYGITIPIWMQMITVGCGEVLGCGVLGMILLFALEKVGWHVIDPNSEQISRNQTKRFSRT